MVPPIISSSRNLVQIVEFLSLNFPYGIKSAYGYQKNAGKSVILMLLLMIQLTEARKIWFYQATDLESKSTSRVTNRVKH